MQYFGLVSNHLRSDGCVRNGGCFERSEVHRTNGVVYGAIVFDCVEIMGNRTNKETIKETRMTDKNQYL